MVTATKRKNINLLYAVAYVRQGWLVVPLHWIQKGRCSCKAGTKCNSLGVIKMHSPLERRAIHQGRVAQVERERCTFKRRARPCSNHGPAHHITENDIFFNLLVILRSYLSYI